jgi:hypothetical protein
MLTYDTRDVNIPYRPPSTKQATNLYGTNATSTNLTNTNTSWTNTKSDTDGDDT